MISLKKIYLFSALLYLGSTTQHAFASLAPLEAKKQKLALRAKWQEQQNLEDSIKLLVHVQLEQAKGVQATIDSYYFSQTLEKNKKQLELYRQQLQLTPYAFDVMVNDFTKQAEQKLAAEQLYDNDATESQKALRQALRLEKKRLQQRINDVVLKRTGTVKRLNEVYIIKGAYLPSSPGQILSQEATLTGTLKKLRLSEIKAKKKINEIDEKLNHA